MAGNREAGQAIILVVVGMSIFLLGAVGLAIDGAQLYAHRQMAQVAADAAAQAGIMSVFDGTDTTTTASSYLCSASPGTTACKYASMNGFGASDTVKVDYLTGTTPAPVNLDPNGVTAMRVTATRNVNTGLMRMLGASSFTTIKAIGMAGIVDEVAPIPIIVLHPSLPAAFQKNGSNSIIICGGPQRSIQVNSKVLGTSISVSGNGAVDLSKAGPDASPGACNGSGAEFGDFGGPASYPGVLNLGSKGKYIQPASPIKDPLLGVPQPSLPGGPAPLVTTIPPGTGACPVSLPNSAGDCLVYSPGRYNGGITVKDNYALFKPGVYSMNGGGFHLQSNGVANMEGSTDPLGVTGTGMVIFNTGTNTATDFFEIASNAGQIKGVSYGNNLRGAPIGSIYKGILFFEDRNVSVSLIHNLQGGGGMTIIGTIYLTHPNAAGGFYQTLNLQGNPGSATQIIGEIIVDSLTMGGTADITMNLDPNANLVVRRVALIR